MMAAMAEATAAPTAPEDQPDRAWYELTGDDVAAALNVDPSQGLSSAEAASRLESYGPNKFAETKAEPRWRAFERQYHDGMQIVLLVAGIGSIWPLKQYGTGIVLVLLTVLN